MIQEEFQIPMNEFQTQVNKQLLDNLPEEVGEQLLDFIGNVEFIKRLVSPDRKRAKDLPRDEYGRIIVDITNPHILEDMDYFRPMAAHFEKHGCYTFLRPNPNPNSEYRKLFDEEIRRCREGYVRESDGEWVTGYMYWHINYCPIMLTKIQKGRKKADRVEGFPEVWEGVYWRFHYLYQAREAGKHAIELAKRGCGKSFCLASMMAKNLILGESNEMKRRVITILTGNNKEFLSDNDGTLSKFEPMINFISSNTEFPKMRLRSSSQDMFWQMGYLDSNGVKRGSLNSVMGISSKDDSDKIRGKRGFIYFEEMGKFTNLLSVYDTVRYGLEDGDFTFGQAYLVGTANEKDADFESAKTLLYSPKGYNIQAVDNVYDKPKQGKPLFGFFFPAYINRKGCYNKDGVSDVIAALIQILKARYDTKYGSDANSLIRVIAEMPITPAEAMIKVKNAYFPVAALTERLQQIDTNPSFFDSIYIGDLVLDKGTVKYIPSNDLPIRDYPVNNTERGAIEIYEMPEKDANGKLFQDRYIIGHDPVDNDEAESSSLSSTFVLDLFTDRIVAEYTGRQQFADYNYEIVRLLCIFYNAKCLYESNKKGIFAYFSKMSCTHLLADTPEYLRDKQLIKYSSFGSNQKGVNANNAINNYANNLVKEWLMKPVEITIIENGEEKVITMPNLFTLKNRALIQELIGFNPVNNFDRIRALGMVMLYREEKMILYNGNITDERFRNTSRLADDDFFTRNYDNRF